MLQTDTEQESDDKIKPSQETFGKDSFTGEMEEQLEKEKIQDHEFALQYKESEQSNNYFKRVMWKRKVTLEEIAEAREYRKHHKRMYEKITKHLQFLKQLINDALEADSDIDTSIIEKSDYGSGYKQGRETTLD